MIKVIFYTDNENRIMKYTVSGHAGYSTKGKDIVCAAVSVLAETTLMALNEVCGIGENLIDYSIDEENGILNVSIPSKLSKGQLHDASIVLKTMEVGIKALLESYPKYITLEYGGV